jgi:calcium/calmodulin-dependent protein kinase (CaM kinase) II
MPTAAESEIIEITQQLLDSIGTGDWKKYEQLCDPSLTAYEPEAIGQLVEGMKFHRFYFELERKGSAPYNSICSPRVHLLGDTAVIAYARLVQRVKDGVPTTSMFEETRVWQKKSGAWKHIHFHRSAPTM